MSPHRRDEDEHAPIRSDISEKSKVRVSLYVGFAICSAIAMASYKVSQAIGDYARNQSDHFSSIERTQSNILAQLTYKWTVSDMAIWSSRFRQSNADVMRQGGKIGLEVPDPTEIKRSEPSTQTPQG